MMRLKIDDNVRAPLAYAVPAKIPDRDGDTTADRVGVSLGAGHLYHVAQFRGADAVVDADACDLRALSTT
jgi:hypothetical protein